MIAEMQTDANCISPPRKTMARDIIQEVAAQHGVCPSEIKGPRRFAVVAAARREAAWKIARDTSLTFPQIGRAMDKDHTSIIYLVRRENELLGENVRNLGGVPEAQIERNRRTAKIRKVLTKQQRLRRAELSRTSRP